MAGENEQKETKFRWNKAKYEAAQLLADGEFTRQEIADKLGVQRSTIYLWLANTEFIAKVQECRDELEEAVRSSWIAQKAQRVRRLSNRLQRMQQIVEERGADPAMQDVPGGKSGLLVHQVKAVGQGEDYQLIDLYALDAGLLREMRDHEKQAAVELGQWTEKVAPVSPDGQSSYDGLTKSELVEAILARIAGVGTPANIEQS